MALKTSNQGHTRLYKRREASRRAGVSLSYDDQANQLQASRAAGDCALANFSASHNVLRRVDKTFKVFLGRCQAGTKAGYPRCKSHRRFDSSTFPS